MSQTNTIEKVDTKLKPPKKWLVLIHNDDVTPANFVVDLLMTVFRHTSDTALELMIAVHMKGVASAGIYPFEIAEQKHNEAIMSVKLSGMKLKLSLKEE